MSAETKQDSHLQIAHVLFIDVVGYSKLLSDKQREVFRLLNELVRNTSQFRAADRAGKLIRLPTGDGMVLAFFTSVDAPVRCAQEIGRKLPAYPQLLMRMGINSGPVDEVRDLDDRHNLTGAGINMAQRVMDCGDAGHILLSKRVADDIAQYSEWQPHLHELGDVEVKHGVRVHLANLWSEDFGNPEIPNKIRSAEQERAATAARTLKARRRRRMIWASATLLLLLSVGIGSWIWTRRTALLSAYKLGTAGIVEKSIAVLPFENLGGEQENAYLADGVQDDILTDLTKVADLKVISRRSVMQYRNTKETIRQIGQALGVAHVLEGSVRKVAGRIHVTSQLIDTRNETQTWAEKYDGDMADVFQIQNEISQAIVTQLKVALSPRDKAAMQEQPTQDKDAYDLYLRARALVYEFGGTAKARQEDAAKAITLLQSAIARDPKFALAYCVLGDAQLGLLQMGRWDSARLDQARQTIDTALRMSPNSPEAHLVLARYFLFRRPEVPAQEQQRAVAAGEKELAIAAAGLPGSIDVFNLRAEFEQQQGKWKEALRDREKAAELNPRDPDTAEGLADLYLNLRRYDDAERMVQCAIAIAPEQSSGLLRRRKSVVALAKGDATGAKTILDQSPSRNLGLWSMNHAVAYVSVLNRDYGKAEEILQSLDETAKSRNLIVDDGNELYRSGLAFERLGRVARFQGEKEKSRGYFQAARQSFQQWFATHPAKDRWYESHAQVYIAEIDAALGRKDDAIREAQDTIAAWPERRDALLASDLQAFLAIVYLWAGEREAALEQLAKVAKQPAVSILVVVGAAGQSAGELKLNPLWDELHNDPRFDKIIAEAAKPVKID
jgi:TolB-like protein/Tfp pilus assembly protein PilF